MDKIAKQRKESVDITITSNARDIDIDLAALEARLKELKGPHKIDITGGSIKTATADAKKLNAELDKITQKERKGKNALDNTITSEIKSHENMLKRIETQRASIQKIMTGGGYKGDTSALARMDVELEKQHKTISDNLKALQSGGTLARQTITDFQSVRKQSDAFLAGVVRSTNEAKRQVQEFGTIYQRTMQFDKLGNRVNEWYDKYENNINKNSKIFDYYRTFLNDVNTGNFASVKDANMEFAKLRVEARRAGVEVDSFYSKFQKTLGGRIRNTFAGYGVFAVEGAVQDIIQNAIAVDTAMTELKKVTEGTESTYVKFMDNAQQKAVDLHASLSDTVNAVASFSRLGYDIPVAEKLAESAIIYKDVGDGIEDMDTASNSIISTMMGFGIEAENSMSIVDKFNEVGNRF